MSEVLNVTFDLLFTQDTIDRLQGISVSLPGLLPVDGLTPSAGDLDVGGEQLPFQVRARRFRWKSGNHMVIQLTMKLPEEVSIPGSVLENRRTAPAHAN
ncbi:TPA: hypothetical protein UL918_000344 [Stenotrophomonas maltophilia]|nr:hypothetical protein [Stenotrophomonas maltophilia]HEL7676013.1 hypothetical protein [Stenotrophomonas maltophilia]